MSEKKAQRKSTRKSADKKADYNKEETGLTEGGLPKVKPNKTVEKFLKTEFTEQQIKEFGAKLARTNNEINELEKNKKAKMSEFTSEINGKKALVETLSNRINTGHEHSNVECMVYLNMPNTGKKTIERIDTKETVEVVDMTVEELQVEMDFKTVISKRGEVSSQLFPKLDDEYPEEDEEEDMDETPVE